MQDPDTVFVGDKSDGAAILREIEFINVPRDVFGEHGELAFFEVEALQALKFGVLVRGDEDRFAVPGELRLRVRDFFVGLWRDEFLCAFGDVDEIDARFVDGNIFADEERLFVWRPILHAPAAAFDLEDHATGFRLRGIHDVNVVVLAVAFRGSVGDVLAALRPARAGVARFAVGEEGDFAGVGLVTIQLIELAAADVLQETMNSPDFGRNEPPATGSGRNVSWRRSPPGILTWCNCVASAKRVVMSISRFSGCQ